VLSVVPDTYAVLELAAIDHAVPGPQLAHVDPKQYVV